MRARRSAAAVFGAALVAMGLAFLPTLGGCKKKPDCQSLRTRAFAIINDTPPTCETNDDCVISKWPRCEMPINKKTQEALKPVADAYDEGECVDPKGECQSGRDLRCEKKTCVVDWLGSGSGGKTDPFF
jgi:hypothetical protein